MSEIDLYFPRQEPYPAVHFTGHWNLDVEMLVANHGGMVHFVCEKSECTGDKGEHYYRITDKDGKILLLKPDNYLVKFPPNDRFLVMSPTEFRALFTPVKP